jgi:hypothetical protein
VLYEAFVGVLCYQENFVFGSFNIGCPLFPYCFGSVLMSSYAISPVYSLQYEDNLTVY